MFARVAWGKVKPGTWQEYEQVYHDAILPETRNVRGLVFRELLHAECFQHCKPELLLRRRMDRQNFPVRALQRIGLRCPRTHERLGRQTEHGVGKKRIGHERHRGFEHVDVGGKRRQGHG